MAFCTNCGKQADGNEKFCTNCGAQLPGVAPQASQPTYQQPAQQNYAPTDQYGYQAPKPAIDKKKLYLLIGAGVAVVAAIVILIVVLTGGGSKAVTKNNVEGSWKITEMSGSAGNSEFTAALNMGGELIMTFKNGTASMKISIMGQSYTQEIGSYEIKDGKLIVGGVTMDCKINGDTMTLSAKDGITMKMKKQ